ncbi:hypothetical protein JOD57_000949 [Geodermatophilus bullaregiensis]|uniref:hypothetical protein n=1 Tax=Geodermatophilus bullaregiensis TaxID=1564160 RepID=UPI00195A409F|nr:hypothetical protein [Geodermatophilus bullaregiensis]MBM7805112.1 hypothetical protein [Geodermatophilus bullaregiensis]
MSRGWPFLVARGRRTDYRTVLVPDFLAGQRLQSLLADCLHEPDDGALHNVVIGHADTGPLTVSYRAEVLRPADMQAAREDHDAPTGATYLSDEHGRPLEYLYGLLQRGDGQPLPADVDMDRARAIALGSYRTFLLDEDGFAFERSGALPLEGSELLDRSASDERRLPVAAQTRTLHPRQPAPKARGPAVACGLPARPKPVESRRGPHGGVVRSAVVAGALALVFLTVVLVTLVRQPAPVGRVVGVELLSVRQDADSPSCSAPFQAEVTARVTVENAPVELVLRLREDDEDGETREVAIEQSGPTDIPLPIDLDADEGQLSLIVESPNELTSDPVDFDLECGSRPPRSEE